MPDLCVLGLGLIGGSVLRAASAAGWTAWGATKSPQDATAATSDGFDVSTDLDAAITRAKDVDALVVIAVPLPAVDEVLRRITTIHPTAKLTDVVSVKAPVAEAVSRLTPDARYVGGHPMAGTSTSGWQASTPTLFHDAAWVIASEDDSDPEVLQEAIRLALATGAHVIPASATEHDAAVGRISHLPHVLAAVLATVGADGGPLALALAAGSFTDGTRVAGTRPELVQAMCEGNRSALLDAVDDALGRLGAARGSLASTGGLAKTIEAGHQARQALENHQKAPRKNKDIDLDSPTAPKSLRTLGARGGRIVSLDGATARAQTS